MSKRMLFPEAFVVDVMQLVSFLEDYNLGGYGNALRGQIHGQIEAKLVAIDRRNAFFNYKSATPGSKEREIYRKEYLKLAGIHEDWCSSEELTP
jgi:hypothetical protein